MTAIQLCARCKKNPIIIKKSQLCSSCYQKLRRENKGRIPIHSSEINFIKNYFTHNNWSYEPTTFNLGKNEVYTPDFYDEEKDIFIFEIRTPDGELLNKKWKWGNALYLKNFDKDLQRQLRILALKRKITLLALVEKCLQKEIINNAK